MKSGKGKPEDLDEVQLALLRGVNLGGKNQLAMKDLADIFIGFGCFDVKTYIQSGNVVFTSKKALASRLPHLVAGAISSAFSLKVPVVTRTLAELLALAANNPFLKSGAERRTLHVAFLADLPSASNVAALDPERSYPDEFAVRGRDIYLRLPNGTARSKLTTQYFDSKLETTSTIRNWNTVQALLELARTRKDA